MKLLNVIASYNLPVYLKNMLDSLLEIFLMGDVLIVDNGSDRPDMRAYLGIVESQDARIKVKRRQENDASKKVGSLYEAYNEAIDHGLQKGYDLFQFLQDDMQFMWYQDGMVEKVYDILSSHKNISMVSPLFQKRIIASHLNRRLVRRDELGTFAVQGYGLCDVGFMSAAFIKKYNFRFGKTETRNAQEWFQNGFWVHQLQAPFLAYIPWPAVRRAGVLIGMEKRPVCQYYYKPLGHNEIEGLKCLSKSNIVFTENYCYPWGYYCLSPYWFTECTTEYLRLVSSLIKEIKIVGADARGSLWDALRSGRIEPDMVKLIGLLTPGLLKRFVMKTRGGDCHALKN